MEFETILRGLTGYLTSYAAIIVEQSLDSTLESLECDLRCRLRSRHEDFGDLAQNKARDREISAPSTFRRGPCYTEGERRES